jgi:hypothetical protein
VQTGIRKTNIKIGGTVEMTEQAIQRIEKELKDISTGSGAVGIMKKPVADTLISFCKQDEEFSQAIVQSDKTFGKCMDNVASGVGSGISDLDAYRKAVQFYFPGADIRVKMTIDLCASVNDGEEDEPKDAIVLDLADFL